jgi:hypothetical protein
MVLGVEEVDAGDNELPNAFSFASRRIPSL